MKMNIITEINPYFPLPFEIIRFVMSFVHSPQPTKLLRDIHSFHETRQLAFNVYYKEWIVEWDDRPLEDKYWFINDIILFANGYQATTLGYIDNFYDYFLRNPRLYNRDQIDKYMDRLRKKPVETQINIFWGLFKPMERKKMLRESLASEIIRQNH
jgi:hypothetical protein